MAASRCTFIEASPVCGTPLTVYILTFPKALQPRAALAFACFRQFVGMQLATLLCKGKGVN